MKRLFERLLMWIAYQIPRKFVYFAAIRVWANATTGQWSSEDAITVTMSEAVKRWCKCAVELPAEKHADPWLHQASVDFDNWGT